MQNVKKMELLNAKCVQKVNKPYYGFKQLAEGYHEIVAFKLVKNKYHKTERGAESRALMVELVDQVLFLPQWMSRDFIKHPKKVDKLNNDGKMLLCFNGMHPEKG